MSHFIVSTINGSYGSCEPTWLTRGPHFVGSISHKPVPTPHRILDGTWCKLRCILEVTPGASSRGVTVPPQGWTLRKFFEITWSNMIKQNYSSSTMNHDDNITKHQPWSRWSGASTTNHYWPWLTMTQRCRPLLLSIPSPPTTLVTRVRKIRFGWIRGSSSGACGRKLTLLHSSPELQGDELAKGGRLKPRRWTTVSSHLIVTWAV